MSLLGDMLFLPRHVLLYQFGNGIFHLELDILVICWLNAQVFGSFPDRQFLVFSLTGKVESINHDFNIVIVDFRGGHAQSKRDQHVNYGIILGHKPAGKIGALVCQRLVKKFDIVTVCGRWFVTFRVFLLDLSTLGENVEDRFIG